MTAVQMQLNTELFGALQVISGDEALMKKAVKSLKRIASQKKNKDEKEIVRNDRQSEHSQIRNQTGVAILT